MPAWFPRHCPQVRPWTAGGHQRPWWGCLRLSCGWLDPAVASCEACVSIVAAGRAGVGLHLPILARTTHLGCGEVAEATRGRVVDIKCWELCNRSCSARTMSVLQQTGPMRVLDATTPVTFPDQLTTASRFKGHRDTICTDLRTSGWRFTELPNLRQCVVHHVPRPPIEMPTARRDNTATTGFTTPRRTHGNSF